MPLSPEPRGTAAATEPEEGLPRMSLLEHLEELRRRILHGLLALVVAVAICFNWAPELLRFLAAPIYRYLPPGSKLAVLGVTDPFLLYFKSSLLAGVFVAFPFLLWQVWRFVAPGLYRRERRWIGPFVAVGWLFFIGGGAFAYYVAFPFMVEFLLGLAGDFETVITAERYYGFMLTIVLGLGLMFELPLVMTLAGRLGLVTPRTLMRHFRWAIVVIFTVSAIVTPPDVLSQCLFAVPTVALYLLGVAGVWLSRPRKTEGTEESAETAAT